MCHVSLLQEMERGASEGVLPVYGAPVTSSSSSSSQVEVVRALRVAERQREVALKEQQVQRAANLCGLTC